MTAVATPGRVRVRALAKINLSLQVLCRNPDGFHELRTLFQTISLADVLEFEVSPVRRPVTASVELQSDIDIPNNLVARAAEAVLRDTGARARVRIRLEKRIPMGGGLGGGSTDAAAVLLALPTLLGRPLPLAQLIEMGAVLGSDVPFFLFGGTALGIGRGTELYPVADHPPRFGILLAPGIHVSTPEAYRALDRPLTSTPPLPKLNSSQTLLLRAGGGAPATGGQGFHSNEDQPADSGPNPYSNDFETVIFRQHPPLLALKRKLIRSGAKPALMSGSGSSLFGLYSSRADRDRALQELAELTTAYPISLVNRRSYAALWRRQLRPHPNQLKYPSRSWPPR